MYTERVVPLGIPNDHCNWTFHLCIQVSAIEVEDMMKNTCRMHCCNILEDHFEDCMIVLGSIFSSCILGTALDFDISNKSTWVP